MNFPVSVLASWQTMADDTEDVELDFPADEQERARRGAIIRCTAGDGLISHVIIIGIHLSCQTFVFTIIFLVIKNNQIKILVSFKIIHTF